MVNTEIIHSDLRDHRHGQEVYASMYDYFLILLTFTIQASILVA